MPPFLERLLVSKVDQYYIQNPSPQSMNSKLSALFTNHQLRYIEGIHKL